MSGEIGAIAGIAGGAAGVPVPTNLDWFKAASPLLSSVFGGGSQAVPNTAISSSGINSNSALDGSGWTVATGKSTATAQIVPWYVYGLAGLALILWYKHK